MDETIDMNDNLCRADIQVYTFALLLFVIRPAKLRSAAGCIHFQIGLARQKTSNKYRPYRFDAKH